MLSSNAIRRAARTIVWNCTATRRGTSSPVCEALESRKLLTQHLYEVPFGHSVAYIQPKEFGDAGQLQIRLDSLSNPPVYPFDNTQGMDVINAGLNPGFVFVDQVPAALKPRFDIDGDAGILVQAGSGATLRIEAPVGDDDIRVIESSATTTTVLTFSDDGQNFSRLGAGVSNLTLRTSDFPAQNFFPGGGTDVRVPFLATDVHLRIETGLGTYDRIFLGENNSIAEEVVVKTGAGNCIVNLQGGNGDDQTTARVDFGSGPLGKGNKLIVFSEGLAKLAPVDGSHRVFVDEVTVSGGGFDERGGFIVEDDATIDRITLSNYADARIKAGATVATSFDVAAQATVSVEAPVGIGAFRVDGTVDFTVGSAPSTVTEFKVSAALVQDATGSVNINTGANVTALATSRVGTLRIPGTGTFTLQPHTSGQPRRVLTVKSLFMGNDPMQPAGVLDLTDNGMVVDYAFSTPHDYIKELITDGYNGGAWNTPGINSSTAATETDKGIGYAEASALFTNFPGTFMGQSVDNTSVLARYTFYGDANLDTAVNLPDFNRLAANFGTGTRWDQGDFNYDGNVNLADFNRQAAFFGSGPLDPEEGDGGGESLLGGEPEYTYEDLLAILMQMYPQYF